jgi:hypothetical protein
MGPDGSVGGDVDDPKPRASRLSIASLVLGIASVASPMLSVISFTGAFESIPYSGYAAYFMIPFGAFASVFAVLFGHVSRKKVGGRPGLKSAASLIGLITGYVGLVFSLLPLLLAFYFQVIAA